jgi:pilus assembly protein Flp/PilA
MNNLRHLLVRIQLGQLAREEGQTMAEYGLLIVFIAIAAIVGITALGTNLSGFFSRLAGNFGA